MAFFNDLGKKLGEVAGETADKAKELAEVAKLKTEISALQKKLQSIYAELGQIYYDQQKEDPASPVAGICARVAESEAAILEVEEKLAQVKAKA